MTPEAMAALHARCFITPPPWSATAFADALAAPGALLLTAPGGFLFGRVAAGEAELLTLAVARHARRQGIARVLCDRFADAARKAGAEAAFLEVAADNAPARTLYAAAGWAEAGRRRRYYGPTLDAIVMRLDLTAPCASSADSD